MQAQNRERQTAGIARRESETAVPMEGGRRMLKKGEPEIRTPERRALMKGNRRLLAIASADPVVAGTATKFNKKCYSRLTEAPSRL